MKDVEKLWQDIVAASTPKLPDGTVDVWLKTCVPLSMEDEVILLDVANDFIKVQIQNRFQKILEDTMKDLGYGKGLKLNVGTGDNRKEQERAERTIKPESQGKVSGLNPNYLFPPSSWVNPTGWLTPQVWPWLKALEQPTTPCLYGEGLDWGRPILCTL